MPDQDAAARLSSLQFPGVAGAAGHLRRSAGRRLPPSQLRNHDPQERRVEAGVASYAAELPREGHRDTSARHPYVNFQIGPSRTTIPAEHAAARHDVEVAGLQTSAAARSRSRLTPTTVCGY